MPTFRVDPIELLRGANHVKAQFEALSATPSELAALADTAPATGDPVCAQQFASFAGQWSIELAAGLISVLNLVADLVHANNEYVDTEAAISDTPVETINWEGL